MKKIPDIWITLILALFLTVALSFILPKDEEKYLGDLFWTKKTFAPKKYDVVFMGDSRTYRGISPKVIESIVPKIKVLNFGYSDGGLNPVMFRAAEEKLADDSEYKIIVLGISPNTITGYSSDNKQYVQELNRPREEVLERLYLNPLLYWFSATSPQDIKNALCGIEDSVYYRNTFHMNGYAESEKFPVDTVEAIPYYKNDFAKYKVEEKYTDVLFDQVKNWTEQGIKVLAFRPPVSVPMKMLEDSVANYNEENIMSGIQRSGGYWLRLNQADYKTYDGSHLDTKSAKKLSAEVAERIKTLTD